MEQLHTFLQQIINGVSLGSIYALIALGYTMVYGIIKLINFAHGDVYMVGAYVSFYAITKLKMGFIPSLLLAMAFCSIMGIVIERLAYKPLRNSTRIAALITAIGVSLFLEYGGMLIVTPQPRAFPNVIPLEKIEFFNGSVYMTNHQLIIIGVTIVLMILLQFVVYKTKIGKAMRAVSYDKDAALLMGISVNQTISATFAIGSALAAAAGVLVGIYYTTISPLMGIIPGLKAFVAAVLGGIGSIPGAAVGGLMMGVIEALVSGYWSSTLRDAVAFAILIIILIIKPSGLFGSNVREKV